MYSLSGKTEMHIIDFNLLMPEQKPVRTPDSYRNCIADLLSDIYGARLALFGFTDLSGLRRSGARVFN